MIDNPKIINTLAASENREAPEYDSSEKPDLETLERSEKEPSIEASHPGSLWSKAMTLLKDQRVQAARR